MRHTPTCVKHAKIWPMQVRELRRKNTEQTELSLEYLERTIAEQFKLIQHGRVPIVYRSRTRCSYGSCSTPSLLLHIALA
jgi:hypothetical protein